MTSVPLTAVEPPATAHVRHFIEAPGPDRWRLTFSLIRVIALAGRSIGAMQTQARLMRRSVRLQCSWGGISKPIGVNARRWTGLPMVKALNPSFSTALICLASGPTRVPPGGRRSWSNVFSSGRPAAARQFPVYDTEGLPSPRRAVNPTAPIHRGGPAGSGGPRPAFVRGD